MRYGLHVYYIYDFIMMFDYDIYTQHVACMDIITIEALGAVGVSFGSPDFVVNLHFE